MWLAPACLALLLGVSPADALDSPPVSVGVSRPTTEEATTPPVSVGVGRPPVATEVLTLPVSVGVERPPVVILLGDINGDGKITIQDVTVGLRMTLGLVKPSEDQLMILDVNEDGKLTIGDITLMLRAAVGLIKS
jgi:hypothetical protein